MLLCVAPARAQEGVTAPREPLNLLAAPEGDTVAIVDAMTPPTVVETVDGWARVRVEGWVRRASGDTATSPPPGQIRLSQLRAEPNRFQGQRVRWRVQYLGTERADELRPDIPLDHAFALLRDPGGEPGFVYAILSAEHAGRLATLAPLQRIEVVGTVVTGRSELTGHPIIDLIEILP